MSFKEVYALLLLYSCYYLGLIGLSGNNLYILFVISMVGLLPQYYIVKQVLKYHNIETCLNV